MGTPEFAIPSLKVLHEQDYSVVAVVTAPDKPRGRGLHVFSAPVKEFALKQNLPILQPENLRDPDFVQTVSSLKPDLIVVVAFRVLPKEVFTIPTHGSFNLHASLLPKYRGAAPIHWAIMNGETETGVTTFFLREKVDTGSVILQARVRIGPDETAGELHDKLAEVGAEIVLQTVRLIELGKSRTRLQDDSFATPAPKIFKEHCRIDWKKSALQIHNFVRGLSPTPCAWTVNKSTKLKIFRTSLHESKLSVEGKQAGEVVHVDKTSFLVNTGSGSLSVREIQQGGKKRLGVEDFLRGYAIEVGDRFE